MIIKQPRCCRSNRYGTTYRPNLREASGRHGPQPKKITPNLLFYGVLLAATRHQTSAAPSQARRDGRRVAPFCLAAEPTYRPPGRAAVVGGKRATWRGVARWR